MVVQWRLVLFPLFHFSELLLFAEITGDWSKWLEPIMLPTGYANGAKKTKNNQPPKPEPIKIGTSQRTYATAYANRPPTKRMDIWSWKMVIHSEDVVTTSTILMTSKIWFILRHTDQCGKSCRAPPRTTRWSPQHSAKKYRPRALHQNHHRASSLSI